MTNRERATNLIASIAMGSLIPAERIPEVEIMLAQAEARGRKAGLEEAATICDEQTKFMREFNDDKRGAMQYLSDDCAEAIRDRALQSVSAAAPGCQHGRPAGQPCPHCMGICGCCQSSTESSDG
jgi:hypothetical protein